MKPSFKHAMAFFAIILITLTSCSKDDNPSPDNGNTSRNVKYEVTGNYTGNNFDVTYTPAAGGALNEDINNLPWSKQMTMNQDVAGITMSVGGSGGAPGQTATLKIYVGGTVVRELTATAGNDGILVAVMQPYAFQ